MIRQFPSDCVDAKMAFGSYSEPYLIGSFHCNAQNSALLRQNQMVRELSY